MISVLVRIHVSMVSSLTLHCSFLLVHDVGRKPALSDANGNDDGDGDDDALDTPSADVFSSVAETDDDGDGDGYR